MGLFSRKPSDARAKARPSISGEAQARELRVRARRRLIGALALALAAAIVVPVLFDSAQDAPQESMIVVPMVVAPAENAPLAQTPDSGASGGGVILAADDGAPPAQAVTPAPGGSPVQQAAQSSAAPRAGSGTGTANRTSAGASNAPPARENAARPTPAPTPIQERTDDGSVALALLEGRQPPKTDAAPSPGGFVLQVAAYKTQADAAARRDRLVQAGVGNAYVETAQIRGEPTYRVRVGPFSTREAAQAAQTRIRALGDYNDAFITSP